MASSQSKAVKTMAEEIARAIRMTVDSNNMNYVNKQITNVVNNASVAGGGSGGIMPGTINASQVRGLYNTVAGYIISASQAAAQGDEIAGRIINTLNGIAAIEVQSARINTAQIDNLYASYGEFIELVSQHATIQGVDTEEIFADIANIGMTNIGQANIGYAQIKDLTTQTAIIREGVAGKLYIDRLAVTDANIVSLTVGELMVRDSNGDLCRVYVDQNGEIATEPVAFDGDDIIAQNSITANALDVPTILDDAVFIGAIRAVNINVDDLFVPNNAFVNKLYTYVISSPVGSNIDISSNSSITLTNQRLALVVSSSSTSSELVLTDKMIQAITNQINIQASSIDISTNQYMISKVNELIDDGISDLEDRVGATETSITQLNSAIQLKASQADLNGAITRIGTLETTASEISATLYDEDTGLAALSVKADAIESDVTDIESNVSTLTQRADTLESTVSTISGNVSTLSQRADTIEASVSDLEGDYAAVSVQANKIDWIVSGDDYSEMTMTEGALEAIANDINLSANDTIRINSSNQISIEALNGIDLSSNESLDIYIENSNYGRWIKFTDQGMVIRRPEIQDETGAVIQEASKWSTLTTNDGFYIKYDLINKPIGAFHEETAEFRSMRINKREENNSIIVRQTSKGGWVWAD